MRLFASLTAGVALILTVVMVTISGCGLDHETHMCNSLVCICSRR